MSNAHYSVLGLIGFFALLQLISINVCVYGVWPSKVSLILLMILNTFHTRRILKKLASATTLKVIEGWSSWMLNQ